MKYIFESFNSGTEFPDDPFDPFSPDEWVQHPYTNEDIPDPVPSGPISSTRPTGYSTAAIELMGFKKGNKSEIPPYP